MNELLLEDLNKIVLDFYSKNEDKFDLFFIYMPIMMSLAKEKGIPLDHFDKYIHKLVINDSEFPLSFDLWCESSNQNDKYEPIYVTGNLGICEYEFNSLFNNRFNNIPIEVENERFIFSSIDPNAIERWLFETVLHYCYNVDIKWIDNYNYQINQESYEFHCSKVIW